MSVFKFLQRRCTYPFVNQTTKQLFRMVSDVGSRISENHIRVITERENASAWDIYWKKVFEPVGTGPRMGPSLRRVTS